MTITRTDDADAADSSVSQRRLPRRDVAAQERALIEAMAAQSPAIAQICCSPTTRCCRPTRARPGAQATPAAPGSSWSRPIDACGWWMHVSGRQQLPPAARHAVRRRAAGAALAGTDCELLDQIDAFQAELLGSRRDAAMRGIWNGVAPRASTGRMIFDMREGTSSSLTPAPTMR